MIKCMLQLTEEVRSSLSFVHRPTLIGKQHSFCWSQTCSPTPLFAVGHQTQYNYVHMQYRMYS